MIHRLACAIFLGLIGCSSPAAVTDHESRGYFPASLYEKGVRCGLLGPGSRHPVMDDFKAAWYGRHLQAAGEEPLSARSGPTLRFTWLRTFQAPVIVRLNTAPTGAVTMTATELSGAGGYEPGVVAKRVVRVLSPQETVALTRTVRTTKVLEQPAVDCRMGVDGEQWIIESVGTDGYRFPDRWAPEQGPVRELGLRLLGFTGWTDEATY